MNRIILITLALAGTAATAGAQTLLLDESFEYDLATGMPIISPAMNDTQNASGGKGGWASSVKNGMFRAVPSVDGRGMAGLVDDGTLYRPMKPTPKKEAGSITAFWFVLAAPSGGSFNGNRIMFETDGSKSNAGYGINFDYNGESGSYTFYNRTGTVNNTKDAVSAPGNAPVYIKGMFTRTGKTTGSLKISYYRDPALKDLIGSQTTENADIASADGQFRPGDSMIIRIVESAGSFVIDALKVYSKP